nr:MAG TPA: hypothetical protein [Caudoviricetes sp.]
MAGLTLSAKMSLKVCKCFYLSKTVIAVRGSSY